MTQKTCKCKHKLAMKSQDIQSDSAHSLFFTRSFKYKVRQKISDINDFVIDTFEDFVYKMREKSVQFDSFIYSNKFYIKRRTDINFEKHSENLKYWLKNLEGSISSKLNESKEDIGERLEFLISKLRDIGHSTNYHVREIQCLKEKALDAFERLVLNVSNNVLTKGENLHMFVIEKKIIIVDEFEYFFQTLNHTLSNFQSNIINKKESVVDDFEVLFENTKWAVEDRKNTLVKAAENTFDNIMELIEEIVEEGKVEIKAEIESIRYVFHLSEYLVTDFLSYCELIASEFYVSSEKQARYLLRESTKKAIVFYTEVVDSLVRGYEDKLLCDNLVLEINSSRYAYNVSMSEVNFHVVRALLTLPRPDGQTWPTLVSRLNYFLPILTNYIRSESAQKDCLMAMEDVAVSHPEIFDVLVKIIHWLYEKDILSEEAIISWYNNPCSESDDDSGKMVRKQVAPFIKWLKEAEEQSSGSEDDD